MASLTTKRENVPFKFVQCYCAVFGEDGKYAFYAIVVFSKSDNKTEIWSAKKIEFIYERNILCTIGSGQMFATRGVHPCVRFSLFF